MLANKKGQANLKFISALVFGVVMLVIAVIVAFLATSVLGDSDLLTLGRSTTTVTNESGGYINTTGYTLAQFDAEQGQGWSITSAYNASGDGSEAIGAGNYTLSAVGVVTNATPTNWPTVNFTYTYTQFSTEELTEERLSGNYTAGVDEVADQVSTVLTIAGVILLLLVLAVLTAVWTRVKFGQGQI